MLCWLQIKTSLIKTNLTFAEKFQHHSIPIKALLLKLPFTSSLGQEIFTKQQASKPNAMQMRETLLANGRKASSFRNNLQSDCCLLYEARTNGLSCRVIVTSLKSNTSRRSVQGEFATEFTFSGREALRGNSVLRSRLSAKKNRQRLRFLIYGSLLSRRTRPLASIKIRAIDVD